jgi:hypothetical protein
MWTLLLCVFKNLKRTELRQHLLRSNIARTKRHRQTTDVPMKPGETERIPQYPFKISKTASELHALLTRRRSCLKHEALEHEKKYTVNIKN